jgi:hypothetical protein
VPCHFQATRPHEGSAEESQCTRRACNANQALYLPPSSRYRSGIRHLSPAKPRGRQRSGDESRCREKKYFVPIYALCPERCVEMFRVRCFSGSLSTKNFCTSTHTTTHARAHHDQRAHTVRREHLQAFLYAFLLFYSGDVILQLIDRDRNTSRGLLLIRNHDTGSAALSYTYVLNDPETIR